jgi:predicted nucleic acid-binding protein
VSVFVDSSVWFAAANIKDRNNAAAKQLLAGLSNLITTDHVLVESWLIMQRHIHRRAAESYWEGIRGGLAVVEKVGLADLETAWAIGAAFPDQDFSIVDRTSFAVMERLRLTRAASFDRDFAIYRYGRKRDRAFEIVR